MSKKFTVACISFASLVAIAVPALATASPVATDTEPPNTAVAVTVGSKVLMTNTSTWVLTINSGGKLECSKFSQTGTVTENSGSAFRVNFETLSLQGTGSGGDCTSPLGDIKMTFPSLPWCMSTTKVGSFELRSGKCSEAARAITFTMDVTGLVNCSYTKATLNGTYTTVGTVSTFKISEEAFTGTGEGNNIFCPTSGKMDVELDMWTDIENKEGPIIWVL
jgi:hypothetical protein